MLWRADHDVETTDWRAVCGRTARTVRRAGRASALPDPYHGYHLYILDNQKKLFSVSSASSGVAPRGMIQALEGVTLIFYISSLHDSKFSIEMAIIYI